MAMHAENPGRRGPAADRRLARGRPLVATGRALVVAGLASGLAAPRCHRLRQPIRGWR